MKEAYPPVVHLSQRVRVKLTASASKTLAEPPQPGWCKTDDPAVFEMPLYALLFAIKSYDLRGRDYPIVGGEIEFLPTSESSPAIYYVGPFLSRQAADKAQECLRLVGVIFEADKDALSEGD